MLLTLKCSRDGKAFAVRLGRRRSSSSRSVEIGIRMMEVRDGGCRLEQYSRLAAVDRKITLFPNRDRFRICFRSESSGGLPPT